MSTISTSDILTGTFGTINDVTFDIAQFKHRCIGIAGRKFIRSAASCVIRKGFGHKSNRDVCQLIGWPEWKFQAFLRRVNNDEEVYLEEIEEIIPAFDGRMRITIELIEATLGYKLRSRAAAKSARKALKATAKASKTTITSSTPKSARPTSKTHGTPKGMVPGDTVGKIFNIDGSTKDDGKTVGGRETNHNTKNKKNGEAKQNGKDVENLRNQRNKKHKDDEDNN